jgi:hypothetical protein
MKTIIELYEGSISSNKLDESSILADVEDTLKVDNKTAWLKLYPLPKASDFERYGTRGDHILYWYCKDFIQQYIDQFNTKIFSMGLADIRKIDTIAIKLDNEGETRVYLTSQDGNKYDRTLLPCIGTKSKKSECIKFLKKLVTSETAMTNMINYTNKAVKNFSEYPLYTRLNGSVYLGSTLFD